MPFILLQEVTGFLASNTTALTEDRSLFQQSLAAFITANENPSTSPNFKSKVPDLPGPLLQLLEHSSTKADQPLGLLLLKVRLQQTMHFTVDKLYSKVLQKSCLLGK